MIDYADIMTEAERLRKQLGEDNHFPNQYFRIETRN